MIRPRTEKASIYRYIECIYMYIPAYTCRYRHLYVDAQFRLDNNLLIIRNKT